MVEMKHPTVDETLALVKALHAGQFDKSGADYWQHPVAVMRGIPGATEHEQHVALLHDVLEDTPTTAADLLAMGYNPSIVSDVAALTKPKGAGYLEWIATISTPAAVRVKIADIKHNLDPARLAKLSATEADKFQAKYGPALKMLLALGSAPARKDVL